MKDKQLIKVLLIEDNPGDARLIREMLSEDSHVIFELFHADRLSKGLAYLERERIDVILLDLGLPDSQGMDTLRLILSRAPQIPIIVETGLADKELAIMAVKAGAQDYLIKGQISSPLLNRSILYAIERKRIEHELRQSEAKYRELVKYAPAGIYEIDHKTGRFKSVNDIICEYTGYTREELLDMNLNNLLTEESQKCLAERIEKLVTREEVTQTVEYCIRTKKGEKLWVILSPRYIYEESKLKEVTGVIYNINDRKLAEEALRKSEQLYLELSIIDDLTQLYNSRHFYEQLKKEIDRSNRYGQPLTLMLLDIDKFKDFNDTYGHIEGDYVLSQIGQVIKRCLRETDSAYRYGGEEFTVILPMTTSEEGIVTAKRIQTELMKESFSPVSDKDIYMTVSIGISQYGLKEEMKSFVHRVDQLMYKAKQNGRDKICQESYLVNGSSGDLHLYSNSKTIDS